MRVRVALIILCLAVACPKCQADSLELRRMVQDRPQLLDVIQPGDPIWTWLDGRFRSTNGRPVYWSAQNRYPRPDHYLSAHSYTPAGATIVEVADSKVNGTKLLGEQVLALLVFELLNASHRDEFLRVDNLARAGFISKSDYLREVAKIEHGSIMELQSFWAKVWVPFAVNRNISINNDFWMKSACEDFDQWYRIEQATAQGYPEDIYSSHYDVITNGLVGRDQSQKTAGLHSQYTDAEGKVNQLPESDSKLFLDGNAMSSSNPEAALSNYAIVAKDCPTFSPVFFNRGNLRMLMGNTQQALDDYDTTILLSPNSAKAYCNRANARQTLGDLSGALADINEAITLCPHDSNYYFNRAQIVSEENDLESAIRDYDTAIFLEPRTGKFYSARASVKVLKGDLLGSISDYSQAIQLDPGDWRSLSGRAAVEWIAGDFPKSLKDYDLSLSINSKNAEAYRGRGLVELENRNWFKAVSDFRKNCDLNPAESDASSRLIWLVNTLSGQSAQANIELARYLKSRPSQVDWDAAIGEFLMDQIDEGQFFAFSMLATPEQKSQQTCDKWYYAGMKRLIAGDKDTAIAYFQRCIETDEKGEMEYLLARNELKSLDQAEVDNEK